MMMRLLAVFVFSLCIPFSSVALADLVVVVHPDNPVRTLTAREVKKLFMGRIRMYPETKLETQVIDLPEKSAAFKVLYQDFIGISATKLRRYRASYLFSGRGVMPLEAESTASMKLYVAGHLSAIGYMDAAELDESVKEVFRFTVD